LIFIRSLPPTQPRQDLWTTVCKRVSKIADAEGNREADITNDIDWIQSKMSDAISDDTEIAFSSNLVCAEVQQ